MSTDAKAETLLLIADVRAAGRDESDVDEIVYDLSNRTASTRVNSEGDDFDEAHDEADALASEVNNRGLDGQVAWIVSEVGLEQARRLLI